MKKSIVTILLFGILLHLSASAQSSDDTAELKTFFQDYLKSYNQNAAETLRKGAVSDYQMLGGDGIWRTLEETCQLFEGAKGLYNRVESETYRVYGNTGVVTGTNNWGIGQNYAKKSLFTYVFTKTPNGWKQVSGHHIDLK
jgi:hypothetical protein